MGASAVVGPAAAVGYAANLITGGAAVEGKHLYLVDHQLCPATEAIC